MIPATRDSETDFPSTSVPHRSLAHVEHSDDTPESLPPTWLHEGLAYAFDETAPGSWRVSVDGEGVLGIVTRSRATPGEQARWTLQHPERENLGVGVSWDNWQDAVANLIDYGRPSLG